MQTPGSNAAAARTRFGLFRANVAPGLLVLAVFAASYFLALSGVYLTQYYMEKGPSFAPLSTVQDGFVRWDGLIYQRLVEDGYRYDGDPCHEQNIVFMPTFPLATRALVAVSGLSIQSAGLLLVRGCFLVALFVLFKWASRRYGWTAALFVVLGLAFSPGSFAFHAFYSESIMLLFLALALYAHDRHWDLLLGVSSFVLGATRVTVAPFSILIALGFAYRAFQSLRDRPAGGSLPFAAVARLLALATLSVGGLLLYLGYIAREFGNPLELIPAIKYCAWQKSHVKMSLLEFVTLRPLLSHIGAALQRPYFFVLDVKTTNLIWTLLALTAVIYNCVRRRFDLLTAGFIGYVLLTFYANGKAEWLESSYRYYAPVFLIYLMVYDAYTYARSRFPHLLVAGVFLGLFAVNVMYMVFYMALFTSGRWHFF